MNTFLLVTLSFVLAVSADPRHSSRATFTLQNGKDAVALNQKFATLSAGSACNSGENACVNNQFAQCVNGQFVTTPCAGGLICAALPLVNSPGTSITCTTAADRDARVAATGAGGILRREELNPLLRTAPGLGGRGRGGLNGKGGRKGGKGGNGGKGSATKTTSNTASSAAATVTSSAASAPSATAPSSTGGTGNATDGDPQTSLTLLQSLVAPGFANDGQDQPEPNQVPSLTSTNNFINFCATVSNLPITNGQQIKDGSCNPAPMGIIASTANMPSSKFVNPKNGATLPAGTDFTVQMAIRNLETGNFVNANANYFAAPQQVNAQGNIKGHSHIVIEAIPALDSTAPTDPTKFTFFKGLNDKDQNGVLSADVPGGLPAGVYRLASINTAANHQPALVAVAQHGALDDIV